jgi:hypothetical protein
MSGLTCGGCGAHHAFLIRFPNRICASLPGNPNDFAAGWIFDYFDLIRFSIRAGIRSTPPKEERHDHETG